MDDKQKGTVKDLIAYLETLNPDLNVRVLECEEGNDFYRTKSVKYNDLDTTTQFCEWGGFLEIGRDD